MQVVWGECLVILEEEAHVKERKLLLRAIRTIPGFGFWVRV